MDTKIFGWFGSHHEKALDELIKKHNVKTVLEIGSFLGKSTAFFAKRVDKVICVDPFVMWAEGMKNNDAIHHGGADFFEQFVSNMKEEGVYEKLDIIRLPSQDAIESVRANYPDGVDLIYIDGAHDLNSVKDDIELYEPWAKKVISGDDFDANWFGVVQAVMGYYSGRVQLAGNFWFVEL